MQGVAFQLTGFRGGHFTRFFARKSSGAEGPGWFVYGRNPAYGGNYVMLCAWRDVPLRQYPNYNCKVRTGWRTKREAAAVAAEMNRKDADCLGDVMSLGALHGTVFQGVA